MAVATDNCARAHVSNLMFYWAAIFDTGRIRSRVYVTFGRPSVCLSHRFTAAAAVGGFAAERQRLQQISIDSCGRRAAGAGAQRQMRVASCWDPTEESQHGLVAAIIITDRVSGESNAIGRVRPSVCFHFSFWTASPRTLSFCVFIGLTRARRQLTVKDLGQRQGLD